MFTTFKQTLKAWFRSVLGQRDYLSSSSNIYDLEERMRRMEREHYSLFR